MQHICNRFRSNRAQVSAALYFKVQKLLPVKANCLFVILLLLANSPLLGQDYEIETSDIDRFWLAYDQLASAESREDSIRIIQEGYIDQASEYFKRFLRVRKFTAEEYVNKISIYPRFWESIRPLTLGIASRKEELDAVFQKLSSVIPDYKQPDVCFAIGTLRTGGTTSRNLILIGSDISAADSTVVTSELSPWLKSVMGKTGDIVSMVAHETIHTQQFNYKKTTLVTGSLKEGIADFITDLVLGLNINQPLHDYAKGKECALWQAFVADYEKDPNNYKGWLYGGDSNKERPADLGYFMGYKIVEGWYANQKDKAQAMRTLLNQKKYEQIYKQSSYPDTVCTKD